MLQEGSKVARQPGVSLAAGRSSKSLGGSTVPAVVVIVVKYRACLLIGRLIVAVQARLFIVIVGTAALSVCRWYVAVRCECWVVIVVERRARLSVGR